MSRYSVDESIPTLDVALSEHMTAIELRKLAALSDEKLPTRKAELAAVILRHLEGERLRTVWQALDELQQAAVAEVVHSESTQFRADRFQAKYGRAPGRMTPDGDGGARSVSSLDFFFYGNGKMPADLKARLRAFVPPPAPARIDALEELPAAYDRPFARWNSGTKTTENGTEPITLAVHESEPAAQQELLSVLRLIDAGRVAVSDRTCRASSSTLAAITAILEGGDFYAHVPPTDRWRDENAGPIRAFAWPLLVQAGGLARLSGAHLQLTHAGKEALFEPASGTIRTLWTRWLNTDLLDELTRVDCVKGQTGKGRRGLTEVTSRRGAIADALAACPVGGWISSDRFLRFMRASGNDLVVTRSAWQLYIGELQYGSLGYDTGERILEHRYLLCVLLEYVATLGLIDVALIPPAGARRDYHSLWGTDELCFFSRYDGLIYFRITRLGAYCLGMASEFEPARVEAKPVFRIGPDLEIAAEASALEQSDRLALDAYASRVSELVWRLDGDRLLSAIEAGRPVAEIREYLAARSGAPLPDTLMRLLDDVADRSTKVHDRGLCRLVECADAWLAALIANDPRTRKHCIRAGERHLVVPASSEVTFRRTLREVGYVLRAGRTRPAKKRH